MASSSSLSELRERKEQLLAALGELRPFRPGSLVERYRKCGRPNCHCARDDSPGHGPSYSLTRAVEGKTRTKIIPAGAVETVQEQIDEYHRFRQVVRDLVETNVNLCDALLKGEDEQSDGAEGSEKGGFAQQ